MPRYRFALRSSGQLLAILLLSLLARGVLAQGSFDYDQSADLATLATLDSERMHYQLLLSPVRDKAELWAGLEQDLAGFSEADYQRLASQVLNQPMFRLQAQVQRGELTYEQLTQFYLYRIRLIESDPLRYTNSIIALNPEALAQARLRDRQRDAGQNVADNPLFGMPILLKDNIGAAGMPTTAGAVALQNNMTGDSFIAARLKENGAVILGKANLSEWAYFFCNDCPSGYSAIGGQTLNPYGRLQFGTGGSSAGSGAAIAADLAVAAVGSETSGSILSPSSANSLVGLKPTTGALSRSGVVPISATLDTAGPMAKTVADVVALFNGMVGFDDRDSAMPMMSDDLLLELRGRSLSGMRLGSLSSYADNSFYVDATDLLAENGAELVAIEFDGPELEGFTEFLGAEMVRDLALYLERFAPEQVTIDGIVSLKQFNDSDAPRRAAYGQALIDMMADMSFSAAELEAMRESLQQPAGEFMEALFADNDLDVLVSVNNRNAGIAALANYPALTVPMGYQDNGRPIGLTFIAPSFQEQVLIDVAAVFERLTEARQVPAAYLP